MYIYLSHSHPDARHVSHVAGGTMWIVCCFTCVHVAHE